MTWGFDRFWEWMLYALVLTPWIMEAIDMIAGRTAGRDHFDGKA